LKDRLGITSKEGTEPSSSHQHTSSTCSNRGDERSNRLTGADQYMDQVVDCETFLATAFQIRDEPFYPAKVAAVDAPFINVLLSPKNEGGDRHFRRDDSHLKGAICIRTHNYDRDGVRGRESEPILPPCNLSGETLPEETEHPNRSYDRGRGCYIHVP
jgi:hypothetical protein